MTKAITIAAGVPHFFSHARAAWSSAFSLAVLFFLVSNFLALSAHCVNLNTRNMAAATPPKHNNTANTIATVPNDDPRCGALADMNEVAAELDEPAEYAAADPVLILGIGLLYDM